MKEQRNALPKVAFLQNPKMHHRRLHLR